MKDLSSDIGQDCIVTFGSAVVYPRMRELRVNGKLVEVNNCAFELMLILIEAQGHIVSKKDLVHRVWPNTAVVDTNLRVNVWKLRRCLGENAKAIKTVPNRGYVLAAPINVASDDDPRPGDVLDCPQDDADSEQARAATIVVIDDDQNVLDALDGLLRGAGMEVEKFSHIDDYARACHRAPPDCIILDVVLPGCSGLEVFVEGRIQNHLNAPVIFISGHADVPMCARALKAGAFDFLTKPIRHHELLEAIQTAIAPKSLTNAV